MDAIALHRDRVWDSHVGEIAPESKAAPAKSSAPAKAAGRIDGARKRAMPERVAAQLATLIEAPPEGDEWLHEIKYDGYRLLARIENSAARLITRKGLDWTAKFPALARELARLPVETAMIDGEVVALKPDGTTSFGDLQDRIATGNTGDLVFFAFDLLYRDGYDLGGAALADRKAVLAEIVPPLSAGTVRYSDHQAGHGHEFFKQACKYQLEGIMSKRADKPYRPGRGTDWLKIKCNNRDEFVIVGFTDPSGTRHGFGALLLGYYRDGTLRYAGRVGTGFNTRTLGELHARFLELERKSAPVKLPKGLSQKGVHWVEPMLVAEVQYAGWTHDAMLRHPSFQGLREDKDATDVTQDPPVIADAEAAETSRGKSSKRPPLTLPSPPVGERVAKGRRGGAEPYPKLGEGDSTAPVIARDGSTNFAGVRLTHAERVLYADQGITKLALAQYFAAVQDWALPHLANRPLSLVRCPDGQGGECFYQKHATTAVPKVVGRVDIPEGTGTGTATFTYIKDVAGLVAMAQMGVLEIHPWGSTVKKLETPDLVTFDFDPDVGLPWERVTEAAIDMREALTGIGLQSFPKTTGGKGLHVVVPIAPKLGWDAVKEFAHWVAKKFVTAYPDRFTDNMAKRARAGRIFIDYLRNGRGATAIGAYSPRARPGAPVATSLSWAEVEGGVKPDQFTVLTVPGRLAKLNSDPWAEMPKLRQSISAKVRREVGI